VRSIIAAWVFQALLSLGDHVQAFVLLLLPNLAWQIVAKAYVKRSLIRFEVEFQEFVLRILGIQWFWQIE